MRRDISIMRIIATLAVVFLHTCNTIANNIESYNISEREYFVLTTGNVLMNWAVPIFFMITGSLLLRKNNDLTYKKVIFKYLKRIVLALFIFGVPFSIMEIYMDTRTLDISMILSAIVNVITGNSWSHLWYLYTLIGVYMILPMLKAFVDRCDHQQIEILLIIIYIFNFIIPCIEYILDINIAFKLPISSFAVFYILLGRWLDDKVDINKYKKIELIMLVALIFSLIGINYFEGYNKAMIWTSYQSPIIALIAALIFLFIKETKINSNQYIWKIDRMCFGVYLVHPVFINFTYKFLHITPLNFGSLYFIAIFIFWVVFAICSWIVVWLLEHIKFLNKYVL